MESFIWEPSLANALVPPAEESLQTLVAKPWFQVSKEFKQLEGLCFDRQGNLLFVEVFGGTIFRLDMHSMKLTEIYHAKGMMPTAIKIHKDGRLYVACVGDLKNGCIFALSPEGSDPEMIIEGHVVDDLIFDSSGGFYFSEFIGETCNPTGGVYYASPDNYEITPVMKNMACPNGVALSVDERVLWVTETSTNRLHMIELDEDGTSIVPYGTSIPYHFTGYLGPDSCCIDSADNLYVAMYGQGRVMIFNRKGYPIGQVLIPGREQGKLLRSTHPALIPETNKLVICTNDHGGDQGAWLYLSEGFAKAHRSFQFH